MKSIRSTLSNLKRLAVVACVCALMLFSNVLPAYSGNVPPYDTGSSVTKGEDKLLDIEEGAQKTVNRSLDLLDPDNVQKKANEGSNEVQGAADIDKQYTPENTKGGGTSVEESLKNALEGVTGKK